MAAACSSCARSSKRAFSTRIAFARFLICERSSWQVTTRPVGTWVMRTAESVVLTPCPPGPEERYTSTRMSRSSTLMSTSSASGSTATVTVEVWIRPLDSVAGTRCTRWTPRSNLRRLQAPRPCTKRTISLKPPTPVGWLSMTSTRHFCASAYLVYMRARSAAKRPASSPPAPARILRNQEGAQLLLELGLAGGQLGHFRLRHLAHLAVGILGCHVAGFLEPGEELLVLLELAHDFGEFRGCFGRLRVDGLLADDGGVGERLGQLPVPLLDLAELVKHNGSSWEAGQTIASPRVGTETNSSTRR